MIDERINKTLSELETNLRNIESARKQVENTVKAYDELKDSTSSYVKSLSSVNTRLTDLMKLIENDYSNKLETFEKDRKTIIDSCQTAINNVNDTAKRVQDTIDTTINGIHKKFTYVLIFNGVILATIIALFFLAK